jgi:hypothetical protein
MSKIEPAYVTFEQAKWLKERNATEHLERISTAVENYLERNAYLIPHHHYFNKEAREHIIRIGTSIMCTKWKVGYPGGSFVQAICDNDLQGAFGRADSTNLDCIKFYVTLCYNLGYVE